MLKNVGFRRNTNSGIPEGVEVASVQAPEGSEAVVQLVAISTVDADGIAQFAGTSVVPLSVSGVSVATTDMTYEAGLLVSYVEGGVTWTVARDGDGNITSITPAA